MYTKLLFSMILSFALMGCSSVPKALSQVQPGWDKSDVVESVGNPSRTFRKNSVDHWVYNYYEDDIPKTKVIQFRSGKVLAVSSTQFYSGASAAFSKSEMEEYKAGLRKKRQDKEEFKDLD